MGTVVGSSEPRPPDGVVGVVLPEPLPLDPLPDPLPLPELEPPPPLPDPPESLPPELELAEAMVVTPPDPLSALAGDAGPMTAVINITASAPVARVRPVRSSARG